jgi:hypothetical protein
MNDDEFIVNEPLEQEIIIDDHILETHVDDLMLYFDECVRDLWNDIIRPYITNINQINVLNKLTENDYIKFYNFMKEESDIYKKIMITKKQLVC